jgi:hypothetical protein
MVMAKEEGSMREHDEERTLAIEVIPILYFKCMIICTL